MNPTSRSVPKRNTWSDLDAGWDVPKSQRRFTQPWDDLRVLLDHEEQAALPSVAPPPRRRETPREYPPATAMPRPTRGGTLRWEDMSDVATPAPPSRRSVVRGGTLQWNEEVFGTIRDALARPSFDDLQPDSALDALAAAPLSSPSSRRSLPNLGQWTRDQPLIEVRTSDVDPGELSILLDPEKKD